MENRQQSPLRVTGYDQFHGSLVSVIFVFGFLFVILFAIWWFQETHAVRTGPDRTGPVKPLPLTEVSLDQNDFLLDILPPTAAPRLSSDLAAVSDVLSSIKADTTISLIDGVDDAEGTREIGPLGLGGELGIPGLPDALPESKRWKLVYQNTDFDNYVQMLKLLEVEIGVVRLKSNEVIRIKDPGLRSNVTHTDRGAEKTNFYFHNTGSMARRWDAKIVSEAGIDFANSALVHFYSKRALEKLRAAETNQVLGDGKTVKDVVSSEFAILPTESGIEFRVQKVSYR